MYKIYPDVGCPFTSALQTQNVFKAAMNQPTLIEVSCDVHVIITNESSVASG